LTFNPTVVRLRQVTMTLWAKLNDDFQSPCGAIATLIAPQLSREHQAFNPTVVRLRRARQKTLAEPLRSFNPTVVRLRPSEKDGLRGQNGRFKALACRRPSVAPKV
ncbi:MAG: hypothetical protein N3B10_08340, partial [Armatimonadetes bacterium]|nr:hypothetical protein [Armatimonadota bacterium]